MDGTRKAPRTTEVKIEESRQLKKALQAVVVGETIL
jgi:hypothetical protein